MEDLGRSCLVQNLTKWVNGSLSFLSWQCLWSQRGGHRQQD
jgi:hypothetical protein